MDKFKLHDNIVCIDLKCFFASVECVKLNKDPEHFNLVVADSSRGKGTIILAISPALKKQGIKNRCRLFELPRNIKTHIAKPTMNDYIKYSNSILKMYLKFFAREDILVYSIDEVFIDLTKYTKLYQMNAYQMTTFLLQNIYNHFGLRAYAGIGPNLLMAKLALDTEAKKNPDSIAVWDYDDLPSKLWPITDLSKVWGIGKGIEARLHKLGINSMYDLAHTDVYQLVNEFGIIGEELYLHAHGIDISKIYQQELIHQRKGFNISHTLHQNTPKYKTKQLVLDLVKQLCERLRKENKAVNVIGLSVRYARNEQQPSLNTHHKLSQPLVLYEQLSAEILNLFDKQVLDINIRKISISFSQLTNYEGYQLSLFDNKKQSKQVDLEKAYDQVNEKYGKNTVFKASALTKESFHFKGSKLVGGHNAE